MADLELVSTNDQDLPLHECVFSGDLRDLSVLLRKGVDVAKKDKHGMIIPIPYKFPSILGVTVISCFQVILLCIWLSCWGKKVIFVTPVTLRLLIVSLQLYY